MDRSQGKHPGNGIIVNGCLVYRIFLELCQYLGEQFGALSGFTRLLELTMQVSEERKLLFNNFVKQVQRIFDNLPKPLEWQSVYIHDLNLLVQADQAVRKVSIQNKLTNRYVIMARRV